MVELSWVAIVAVPLAIALVGAMVLRRADTRTRVIGALALAGVTAALWFGVVLTWAIRPDAVSRALGLSEAVGTGLVAWIGASLPGPVRRPRTQGGARPTSD